MSNSEEVKRLAELKSKVQEKIKALKEDIEMLESTLSIIDSLLLSKSFKKVEAMQAPPPQVAEEAPPIERLARRIFPLKASDGTMLAKMYVTNDDAWIIVEQGLNLYVSTPPFQSFLVNRVLKAMAAKDKELASEGKLSPDKAFRFEIKVENDTVKEIHIRNYRDRRRLRELRTSTRWTLEKMYEKQKV